LGKEAIKVMVFDNFQKSTIVFLFF
jgi:hypothetical protein